MKHGGIIGTCIAGVCVIMAFSRPAPAELVDRIAATVARSVITESEVDRQIRLTAFLNGDRLDFSPSARRQAAQRLVEQTLVRREMDSSGLFETVAAQTEIDPQVKALLKERYPTDADYRQALQRYGLTDEDVQEQLAWQSELIRFVDMRFRPGVQVPDADIRDYYEHTLVPEWPRTHSGNPPALEAARDDIEKLLMGERANAALDRWLGRMRTQTDIRFRAEAFQ